jgi:hypothetical protein
LIALVADCGMAESVAKGQEFFQQAQKKLKGFSFFGKSTACTQAVPNIVQASTSVPAEPFS